MDQKHAKTNKIWRQNSEIHSPFPCCRWPPLASMISRSLQTVRRMREGWKPKHMFGHSLFRPSRQSNIPTSGEERFKYLLPWENRIRSNSPPLGRQIQSNPRRMPSPLPPPPRRLYIDRCIIWDGARKRGLKQPFTILSLIFVQLNFEVQVFNIYAPEVASLLSNLNLDFAIWNLIFHAIKRLQSERSTSALGSFRLVSQSGFIFLFHLRNCFSIARTCSFIDKHGRSRLVRAKVIYTPPLLYAAKGL